MAVLLLAGCRESVPKTASETITLMTKYSTQKRYDDAIKLAQDWLKKHPDDNAVNGTFYEQIAMIYLVKASKDPAHKEEWFSSPLFIMIETSRSTRSRTLM